MAYALRYYKEIAQTDGGVVRLEIHKKDSTTSAVEIGAVVQGLSLEIQGQQDDIDTPIQKTSLHMTFVDASDIENGQKNGFWEEFYTPDALMWKVVLKAKDAGETSFRTIWGGYVTPDSFSEDLVYRGSVSITARDNIGHMQDFPFDALGDADGLISLYNLVSMGWEKIQSPMDLLWNGLDWLSCNDVIAYHTLMNVSQFKDMNWYKAIVTALASYGAVMRYAGENEVYVTTLRYMPSLGRNIDLMDRIEPVFIAGAQRELVPAVKRIEESVDYELESALQPLVKPSDFSGNTHVLDHENDLDGYSLTNTEEGQGWFNSRDYEAIYFSPSSYIIEEADNQDIENQMYVVAGIGYNNKAEYSRTILAQDITINITFGTGLMRKRFTDASGRPSGGYYLVPRLGTIFGISYAVYVIQDGVKMYYNFASGEWNTQASYRTETNEGGITEITIPVALSEFKGNVILGFDFGGIDATIPYVNIASVTFSNEGALREKNTVNTIYNADNNVILSRDPEIGPAFDKVALPAFIKNGIFYRNGDEILPARLWSWGGSEQQMAVWNHLQLLCYYAKPNNLISGTIVNADITRFAAIYEWNHAEHILVSGRYNFLNGHIEGAVLREFARYEDMWSEVAGAGMPETEQDSRSNVEGGASSSSSPSTYTATQNVNIGTGGGGGGASYLGDLQDVDVTGVVAQSVLYYNGTSWVDMSFASLVNPLLNPYLKSVDADATYATKTALSGVETAVSANTTAIAGLGTRMTNAETELGLRYSKTEVNNLLAKYLLLEAESQTIKGDVTIEGNLVVKGDTSTGGTGSNPEVAGTLIGIKVNGQTYDKPVNGILTIPDYPTSLEWSAINGKPTKLTEFTNDAGFITSAALANYLPKSGGTLTGAFTLQAEQYTGNYGLDANNSDIINVNAIYTSDLANQANEGIQFARTNGNYDSLWAADGVLYFSPNGNNPEHTGSYSVNNTIYHSGNFNPANYLPLSGGTINGTAYQPFNVESSYDGYVRIGLYNKGSQTGFLGWSTNEGIHLYENTKGNYLGILADGTAWCGKSSAKNILIHSGNIGSQKVAGLVTARTIWGQSFDGSGNVSGHLSLGTYSIEGVQGSAFSAPSYVHIGYETSAKGYDAYIDGNNIYLRYGTSHTTGFILNSSGNVTFGASDLASTNYKLWVNGKGAFGGPTGVLIGNLGNTIDAFTSGGLNAKLHLNPTSTGAVQMCLGGGNVLIGTSTDSGYKLDVNGDIAIRRSGSSAEYFVINSYDISVNYKGYDTSDGYVMHRFYSNDNLLLTLDGRTKVASFVGGVGIAGAVTMSSRVSIGKEVAQQTTGRAQLSIVSTTDVPTDLILGPNALRWSITARNSTDQYPYSLGIYDYVASAYRMRITSAGDVHIYKNLVVSGDTSSGSDIRFKDKLSDHRIALSDIAEAPLFTFKWNDREDDSVHLGSSAQYWEKVAPWLVKGEDFKTLDYSTLGVAIGISLANKAVNHEERIKILERENEALKAEIRRIQYGS